MTYQKSEQVFLNLKEHIKYLEKNLPTFTYSFLESIIDDIKIVAKREDITEEQTVELINYMKKVLELRREIELPLDEPKPIGLPLEDYPSNQTEFFVRILYFVRELEKIYPHRDFDHLNKLRMELQGLYPNKKTSELIEMVLKDSELVKKGKVSAFTSIK